MNETASAAEATGTKIGDTIDKGTTKAGSAISKLGALGANFGIPFSNSLSKIGDKFAETSTKGEKFLGTVNEVGKVALGAGAIGLVAFGGEAIKLGSQLEDSQASLKAAVSASGESLSKWQGPIAAAQAQMEKFGFTNADVNNALAKSVISTQDVGKSLNIMSIAANLAAAKHVDLSTAIGAVDKAAQGNTKALMQMGISLPIVTTNALKLQQASDVVSVAQAKVNAIVAAGGQGTSAYRAAVNSLNVDEAKLAQQHAASSEILGALSQRLGGQAATAAKTFSGEMKVLKTDATDVGAQIGTVLIPIIQKFGNFLINNKGLVKDLAIGIGVGLVAAIGVFAGTTIASMSLVDAALGGLPIIIGAVVVGALELKDHWGQVMGDLKNWAIDAVNFVIGQLNVLIRGFDDIAGHIPFFGSHLKIAELSLLKVGDAANKSTNAVVKLHAAMNGQATAIGGSAVSSNDGSLSPSVNDGNATLVAAQSQANAGTAGVAGAKAVTAAMTKAATTHEAEIKRAAAAIVAEHKKAAALIVSDTKAGNAALNTQINLTTATSMTALNTGLNATHNAALAKVEHTLELTHDKNLKALAVSLVKTHAAALANWVAQQNAATASGNLTNAKNAATVTADKIGGVI